MLCLDEINLLGNEEENKIVFQHGLTEIRVTQAAFFLGVSKQPKLSFLLGDVGQSGKMPVRSRVPHRVFVFSILILALFWWLIGWSHSSYGFKCINCNNMREREKNIGRDGRVGKAKRGGGSCRNRTTRYLTSGLIQPRSTYRVIFDERSPNIQVSTALRNPLVR